MKGKSRADAGQFLDKELKMPALVGAEISPDGEWAAWSWFHVGPAADVFCVPTDGKSAPLRLTRTNEDTMVESFTPDSKAVIVGEDTDGDERVRLFLVRLDEPLKMVPLTEANPEYYIQGGQMHPNGHWLFYGANFDFVKKKEIEPTWIYRHDTTTGERKPLAKPRKAGFTSPHLNRQGTLILYHRNDLDPAGQQVWLVDCDGREDREILNFGPKVKVFASWFPDGDRALFLAESKTYRKVGIWERKSGKIGWLVDDPERNVEGAFVPENGTDAILVELAKARNRCSLLDCKMGRETPCPSVSGNLIAMAPIAGGRYVGEYYSAQNPVDLVTFSLSDTSAHHFKSLTGMWGMTDLTPADFAPAEDFSWKSTDGRPMHGYIYRAKIPIGTIVYIHGGPTHHHEDRLDVEVQYYVQRGFNVFDPNYRGSTGYGLAFQDAIKEDGWGGREQDDIRTGIEALIASGIAQKGMIGVTGTSFGGYSSWWAITHFPTDVVAAAAPICGMTDLVVDYETTRPDLRPYSEEMMGGSPAAVPARYKERSPINYVSDIKGFLLIVQGLRDPNVTPENVRKVEAELKKNGIKYELLQFADEGHGIAKPRNERILYERIADFFSICFK